MEIQLVQKGLKQIRMRKTTELMHIQKTHTKACIHYFLNSVPVHAI